MLGLYQEVLTADSSMVALCCWLENGVDGAGPTSLRSATRSTRGTQNLSRWEPLDTIQALSALRTE
eukprot:6485417-Amphidinium_carterae.1